LIGARVLDRRVRPPAKFMLVHLTEDTYVRKIMVVATSAGQPNMVTFLWREGFSKRVQPSNL
jgi:hypothetical protein